MGRRRKRERKQGNRVEKTCVRWPASRWSVYKSSFPKRLIPDGEMVLLRVKWRRFYEKMRVPVLWIGFSIGSKSGIGAEKVRWTIKSCEMISRDITLNLASLVWPPIWWLPRRQRRLSKERAVLWVLKLHLDLLVQLCNSMRSQAIWWWAAIAAFHARFSQPLNFCSNTLDLYVSVRHSPEKGQLQAITSFWEDSWTVEGANWKS